MGLVQRDQVQPKFYFVPDIELRLGSYKTQHKLLWAEHSSFRLTYDGILRNEEEDPIYIWGERRVVLIADDVIFDLF